MDILQEVSPHVIVVTVIAIVLFYSLKTIIAINSFKIIQYFMFYKAELSQNILVTLKEIYLDRVY